MNRTLSFLVSLFIPRTLGGRVYTSSEFVHAHGQDRLALRFVADSLYWRLLDIRGGSDFHSLVWERRHNKIWKQVTCATPRIVRRVASAWISGVHGLDAATGVAIIQIGRSLPMSTVDLPPNVLSGAFAQYTWVAWDMHDRKLLSVLKECKTPFERYDA